MLTHIHPASPTHKMQILKNDEGIYEVYCPECGRHLIITDKMHTVHHGNQLANHTAGMLPVKTGTEAQP